MPGLAGFEFTSVIPGDTARFLAAFDLRAVNRELGPFLKMTAPAHYATQPIMCWPAGEWLFSSWILLFGILPVDRHRFRLAALHPGCGFNERSSSWVNREWAHERRLETVEGGIRVTDRVSYVSRLVVPGALLLPLYRAVFAHRHRRLRQALSAAKQ